MCYRVSTPTPPWWLRLFWLGALRHFWLLLSAFRLWCWTRWQWYFTLKRRFLLEILHKRFLLEVLLAIITLRIDVKRDGDIAWDIFFRSILDSFETRHTPSTRYIPPSVFENTTGSPLALAPDSVYLFQGPDSYLDEERAIKHHLLQLQRSFTGQLAGKHGPSRAFGKVFLWPQPKYHSKYVFQADFVSGACLGAFISTIFYPVNTTKTHMQKTLGGDFQSFLSVFRHLLKERGAWGMFRGVHVNYTRSFMSWGIINMSYSWLLGLLASWSLWYSAEQDSDEPWRPAELNTT